MRPRSYAVTSLPSECQIIEMVLYERREKKAGTPNWPEGETETQGEQFIRTLLDGGLSTEGVYVPFVVCYPLLRINAASRALNCRSETN